MTKFQNVAKLISYTHYKAKNDTMNKSLSEIKIQLTNLPFYGLPKLDNRIPDKVRAVGFDLVATSTVMDPKYSFVTMKISNLKYIGDEMVMKGLDRILTASNDKKATELSKLVVSKIVGTQIEPTPNGWVVDVTIKFVLTAKEILAALTIIELLKLRNLSDLIEFVL